MKNLIHIRFQITFFQICAVAASFIMNLSAEAVTPPPATPGFMYAPNGVLIPLPNGSQPVFHSSDIVISFAPPSGGTPVDISYILREKFSYEIVLDASDTYQSSLNLGSHADGFYELYINVCNSKGCADNTLLFHVLTNQVGTLQQFSLPVYELLFSNSQGGGATVSRPGGIPVDFTKTSSLGVLLTEPVAVPPGDYDRLIVKTCDEGSTSTSVTVRASNSRPTLVHDDGSESGEVIYYTTSTGNFTTDPSLSSSRVVSVSQCQFTIPMRPISIGSGEHRDLRAVISTQGLISFNTMTQSVETHSFPQGIATDSAGSVTRSVSSVNGVIFSYEIPLGLRASTFMVSGIRQAMHMSVAPNRDTFPPVLSSLFGWFDQANGTVFLQNEQGSSMTISDPHVSSVMTVIINGIPVELHFYPVM